MDVLFVNVPENFRFPQADWCLGYRYMAAALREAGFTAEIAYPRFLPDRSAMRRLIRDVVAVDARIVGFTTYDVQLPALLVFIRRLRRAGLRSHITLGGPCATSIPRRLLEEVPDVDSVVVGEGEASVVELAQHLVRGEGRPPITGVWLREDGRVVAGEPRPMLANLAELPEPALDDLAGRGENSPLRHGNGCVPVTASRGCYGRCTFCSVERFYRSSPGRPWRGRAGDAVARDAAAMLRVSGFSKITFVDENFMGPGRLGRRHALEIGEAVKGLGVPLRFNFGCRANDVDRDVFAALKDAGLAAVTIGVESMHGETLELFNKANTPAVNVRALAVLEDLGLPVEITFIFFHPLSTLDEIRDNLAFVERVRRSPTAYFSNQQPFTEFIPFFGTGLTKQYEDLGLVQVDLNGYELAYADPRVAFVATQALGVPLELLARLRYALPESGGSRAAEIQAHLRDYQYHLSLVRIPELIAELCDLLKRGASTNGRRVRRVTAALRAERTTISSLVERFAVHARD
jgi:anaerobic magnesium-protoporphyrin IX monomethyl ester cyclase